MISPGFARALAMGDERAPRGARRAVGRKVGRRIFSGVVLVVVFVVVVVVESKLWCVCEGKMSWIREMSS